MYVYTWPFLQPLHFCTYIGSCAEQHDYWKAGQHYYWTIRVERFGKWFYYIKHWCNLLYNLVQHAAMLSVSHTCMHLYTPKQNYILLFGLFLVWWFHSIVSLSLSQPFLSIPRNACFSLCKECYVFQCNVNIFVAGFMKRGLPHTINFMNLEDHKFVIKRHMKLKLSQAIKLCWCFILNKFQVNSSYQCEVTNRQSW